MENNRNGIQINNVNTSALSSLVMELNIARRNFRSYPKDHPIVVASFNKVINCYDNLLNLYREITIGVARDTLLIGDETLDKKNLVFQDFAKVLYEHGIAALMLQPGLKIDELRNFNIILSLKREDVIGYGGIATVWEKSKIKSLAIVPIQYDLFSSTEVESVSAPQQSSEQIDLWESFTRGIINGTLGNIQARNDISNFDDDVDPETLAILLNRQLSSPDLAKNLEFSSALNAIELQATKPVEININSKTKASCEKLAIFVNKLDPNLRRKFLSSGFDKNSLSGSSLTEEIVSRFSDETIIETMDDIKQDRINLPTGILKLIQKLSIHAIDRQHDQALKLQHEYDINQKIRGIFCEHESEDFTPESHKITLERIVSIDQTCQLDEAESVEISSTLDSHLIENHLSDIILRLMILDDDEEHTQHLVNSLSETYYYLLQTGDYEQLVHLIKQCDSPEIPINIRRQLRSNYTSRDCLEEMLVGLTTWGKPKYIIINNLIKIVGEPFIEVLLDRLAEEENLSLRRFLMDRIQEFGSLARDAIICRLSDNRWFVLRNFIIILRTLNDNSILEHIRHLMHHSNIRVRQEALRTCLQFQDPAAERQVLYDMSSNDRETQLAAIALAEKSRSIDVFKKLLSIISKPGLSNIEYELKSAAIQALGEIGKADAIPELAKVLASKSLLYNRQLSKLKSEITRSLRNYPSNISIPILRKLASGSGEVAGQAAEILKVMAEKKL